MPTQMQVEHSQVQAQNQITKCILKPRYTKGLSVNKEGWFIFLFFFFLLKQRRHHCCIPALRGREEVAKLKKKLQKSSTILFQEIKSHLYPFATCKTLCNLEEFQINRSTATSFYYANIYLALCGVKLKRKKKIMLRQIPIKHVPNCTVMLVSGLLCLPQVKESKLSKCFSTPIKCGTCPFYLLCLQEATQLTLQIPFISHFN